MPGSEARRRSIWPAIYPELLELVRAHRSTLVFVNSRRLAERLALRLNELAEEEVARAHHGSLAPRAARRRSRRSSRPAACRALVATSSLELGIDMGAVDLVVQVESPRVVARGLQRIGRAGHQVGAPSRGRMFPKYRGDLVECAAVVERMRARGHRGDARPAQRRSTCWPSSSSPSAPTGRWTVDELRGARAAAPTRSPSSSRDAARGRARHAGRPLPLATSSPSCARASCGTAPPGRVRGRDGARALAVQNAGTIPDRGLYAWCSPDGGAGRRARRGDGLRGALRPDVHARRHHLAHRGDHPRPGDRHARARGARGRSRSGRARASAARPSSARPSGASRASSSTTGRARGRRACATRAPSTGAPPRTWSPTCEDQAAATGAVPSDRAIVVERFRDEIGDWRLCVLSPFGARVHAPWALALRRAHPRPSRPGGARDLGRRRHRRCTCPTPTLAPVVRHRRCIDARTSSRTWWSASWAARRLFGARFRENAGARAADPAPPPGPAHAALAAAPARRRRCCRWRAATAASRSSSRRTASACNDWFDLPAPARRAQPRRRSRELGRGRGRDATASPFAGLAAVRVRRLLHVRGRHARAPSAARRRCRSTATCCASCSARRSCASSSTRTPSRRSRPTCRASPSAAAPAAPTGCTTCCGALGDLTPDEIALRVGGAAEAPALVED